MISIHPKKFKAIKNKAIPNPLRPKFRNKAQANIYFQENFKKKREISLNKKFKMIVIVSIVLIGGYFLSN